MAYDINPRKIYGKVEIVYSDIDISSVSGNTVSDTAEISHPEEVYGVLMVPTVKACTMDGNATMNGTFQMMDNACVVGWWGEYLSGVDGVFSNYPTIEIFFSQRPIVSWLITGDTKLNQYPTDFLVEYKRGNTVVDHQEVTDNNVVQYRLVKTVIDVTSIKLTIYKWNVANACVKLLRFFDTLVETYDEADIQSFEVNEELCAEDSSFSLNSDSMTVTIYNKERKFTTGYLKNLLILDRKVKPYIGTIVNGVITYTALGTFYSEEWKVSDDGRWVKCTAIDKLMRLQNKTYIGYPLTFGVSLYEIAQDIFAKAGISASKYAISEELENFIIGDAFMPKSSVWDALQQIAYAGLCNIYIDRDDKIIISSIDDARPQSAIEVVRTNMFSYISNISLTEFANKISVDYADVTLGEESVEAATTSITLSGNEELEIVIDYTTEVVYSFLSCDNENIEISNFTCGIDACKVTLTNHSSTSQTGTITITGYTIEINYKAISVEDEVSVRDYGAFEYKHQTSDFIQDSIKARQIATKLLNRMKSGEGTIKAVWRGNPGLELGNAFNCDRGPDEENTLVCEANKITFDGSLRQETRGRKIS